VKPKRRARKLKVKVRRRVSEKACPECSMLSVGSACPNCKATGLSDDFTGLVIIFDPERSAIAKAMKMKVKGRYALRVR
jgi:DNA-directed RNA polymerase subunit E"